MVKIACLNLQFESMSYTIVVYKNFCIILIINELEF